MADRGPWRLFAEGPDRSGGAGHLRGLSTRSAVEPRTVPSGQRKELCHGFLALWSGPEDQAGRPSHQAHHGGHRLARNARWLGDRRGQRWTWVVFSSVCRHPDLGLGEWLTVGAGLHPTSDSDAHYLIHMSRWPWPGRCPAGDIGTWSAWGNRRRRRPVTVLGRADSHTRVAWSVPGSYRMAATRCRSISPWRSNTGRSRTRSGTRNVDPRRGPPRIEHG